ncbi:MAG: hypothetical protein AAFX96_04445 [Pseudomonadota bacterium]
MSKFSIILLAAVSTLLASIFWTFVFAFSYRIPVPFAGYAGPFGEIGIFEISQERGIITSILFVWYFYTMLGGFLIHLIIIAISAVSGWRFPDKRNATIVIASLLSFIPVFILSFLDQIIGQW